jgi:hypothetical protein
MSSFWIVAHVEESGNSEAVIEQFELNSQRPSAEVSKPLRAL